MKFARELAAASQSAPPVFKGSFLNYAGLKKFLKFRWRQLEQIPPATPAAAEAGRAADVDFLRMLAGQLREVDRRFDAESGAVVAAFDAQKSKRRSFRRHRDPASTLMDPKVALQLADRARDCLAYAQLNAQALRKIAKKHDKIYGSKVGQQFVQACWRGDIAVSNFLSAPMLSELSAVEELLRSKAAAAADPGHVPVAAGECAADRAGDAFKCAVCLDLMYQPVALECGHKFCARCAIATAVGHDRNRGGVDSLLKSGPVGCSEAPCPQCRATEHGRQGRGVFFDARRLPHLDELIESRFPEEWQRRKAEEEAEQRELKAAKAPHGFFQFLHKNSLQSGDSSAGG